MDSAFLLVLTLASLIAWFVAITDKTTPPIYRALGVFFGVPILMWYTVFVIGATKSPVWNGIGGGPLTVAALALGVIAFMSREKKPRPPADHHGLPA